MLSEKSGFREVLNKRKLSIIVPETDLRHASSPINITRYERIVNRIKDTSLLSDWTVAKKLLGWMVCAKRQLTWKEMQVALSINIESQEIEYDDRHLRTTIHDICGSLVIMSGDRVTLVHSTAKTYVLSQAATTYALINIVILPGSPTTSTNPRLNASSLFYVCSI
jgi:hypothetical protein